MFSELTPTRSVGEFVTSGKSMLDKAVNRFGSQPFRVWTEIGLITVLRPHHGDEIRNDRRFNFLEQLAEMFPTSLPGFEPYKEAVSDAQLVQNLVKLKITRSLAKMTPSLKDECTSASIETLGFPQDWKCVVLKDAIVKIVTRMSSRIFVGEGLCRTEQWPELVISYGFESAMAAEQLKLWPKLLRPVLVKILPSCTNLRARVREADMLITEELRGRMLNGTDVGHDDSIAGFKDLAQGKPYNAGAAQLMLAIVAILTTADLVTQALLDIICNSDLIEPLREEILRVLAARGWSKAALTEMKLLDSVLKEIQRLKPNQITSMHRNVNTDVVLSDEFHLAAGTSITVSAERMRDPLIYDNPDEFDGYRFERLRQTSNESRHQLVGTSLDHLGFGFRRHACPGRFFAADEAKIALSHLLLEYEWKLSEGPLPVTRKFGFTHEADPDFKVMIKKRA
ncbi:cytochrome P450 monooxygenase [Fusarium albosuccineum]|uniref:Cytochrome P450 monooxygenase n=1 Tax=Fusarium albosuccineum TaxID=1237068 RepID=A0A8H4LI74_9HYPO|nr:cytochrome P450 monooxygenase [Fusarium albosuccineum]